MVELLAAVAVFSIGGVSAIAGMVSAAALARTAIERSTALEAAQGVVESLQAEEFAEVFVRYNGTTLDDLPGPSPGNTFAVPGLNVRQGDPDGLVGEVLFPGDGFQLFESGVDPELGMPRDLNADGVLDGADHSGDYNVLPVRVRVSWRSPMGDRQLEIATILTNDKNVP